MPALHSLLRRQLTRVLGTDTLIPEAWRPVVDAVDAAYRQFDSDRRMLERSLDLSSQELLQANAELRGLFQAFPDVSFRLRADGTILDQRGGGRPETQDRPEELIGKHVSDLVSVEEASRFECAIRRVCETGEVVSLEYSEGRGESKAYFEARLVPIPGEELMMLVRDISERKRAERRVEESERRYRLLFENALVGVYRTTESGTILDCNTSFAQLLGYASPQELQGRMASSLYASPSDRETFIARLRQRRALVNQEWCGRRRDGTTVWLLENVAYDPLDEAGGVLQGTVVDITARKRAELERQESLALFWSLIENMDAAVLVERDDRTVFAVNSSFCRVFTLEGQPESMIGRDRMAIAAGKTMLADRASFLRGLTNTVGDPQAVIAEEIAFADGRLFERDSIPIYSANGEFVGRMWQYRDVTEHRRLEAQLRQSQKMEAMGRLAGGVAHDFNNLLTIILGYTALAVATISDPAVRDQVEEVKKAAERAAGLTRQLLAFSRKQVLQLRVVELNSVIVGVQTMLQRLIGEDIRVVTRLDPRPGRIRADIGGLEQIVVNLAVNARHAMPDGGELVLETSTVTAREIAAQARVRADDGAYVMLTVSDTGCGMDRETQARAFEPFFTTKVQGKGTGLGLSTVYGIVKQCGGHIWLESEPGQGARVRICLPTVDAPLEEPVKATSDVNHRGNGTVLVLEDDPTLRHLARRTLSSAGYEVLAAGCGAEAMRLVESFGEPIHLLLADVVLPDIAGPVVAEQIRGCRPELRVLFMSGYAPAGLQGLNALEPGVRFLPKPFTPTALLAMVEVALRGQAGECPSPLPG